MPARLSDLDSGSSLHTIYGYVTGLLLALVAIEYQGLNTTPFQQHPALMILFLIATTVYVMALIVLTSNHQINLIIMAWMCRICGSFACELLLLLLASPIWCFIINLSPLALVLTLLFCYNYLFQPQSVEGQATEMTDLEAAVTPHP